MYTFSLRSKVDIDPIFNDYLAAMHNNKENDDRTSYIVSVTNRPRINFRSFCWVKKRFSALEKLTNVTADKRLWIFLFIIFVLWEWTLWWCLAQGQEGSVNKALRRRHAEYGIFEIITRLHEYGYTTSRTPVQNNIKYSFGLNKYLITFQPVEEI